MLNDDIKYEITLKSVLNLKEIGTVLLRNCVPVQDLQKLMDEAEHGVIYFSMGSNAKSKDFPDAMKEDFLRVFGQVKQTVRYMEIRRRFAEQTKECSHSAMGAATKYFR